MPSANETKQQQLGLAGCCLLCIGVFTPIVSVPIVGSLNYFQNGKGDGVFILALAAVSLFLVLTRGYEGLRYTSLGSLGVLLFTFIRFQTGMSEIKAKMDTSLADNPFRGIADAAVQGVQLEWGWAVLLIGALLLLASAFLQSNKTSEQTGGDSVRRP